MSNAWARTYDYPVPVTKSDTADDPAGPFAGALCSAAGNALVWPLNGPQGALPLTIVVVAGQYLDFPIRRFGASTTATMFGLVSAIVNTGR
jgi:hypothetical protein